jgi:GntR family transcriptional regulator, transcriptional repressor for pyruvate dehydrogenase complex
MDMDLVPVVRSTTAQTVARQILDMIRRGAWKPGDQLPPEKELMERLAVGRSTVREAYQILATLNIVQAAPGQGTFIKEPKASDVLRADVMGYLIGNPMALELLEAREMIEPNLVRLAAIRGTEADFDRIEALLDEHERASREGRPVSEYAARFHLMIAEAAHNRVAVIFMTSILELLMNRGRKFDDIPDYQQRELAEHRELLRLVRSRDADRAAEFLLRHIVDSATTYDREGVTDGKSLLATAGARNSSKKTGGTT